MDIPHSAVRSWFWLESAGTSTDNRALSLST